MTRSKALGFGLPAWTLVVVGWLFFGGSTINGPGCLRLVGVSAQCAAQANAANLADFYFHIVPIVATWFGGYFLLGMLTVRARLGRLGLVAIWFAIVIAFALLSRPNPIQPYPG